MQRLTREQVKAFEIFISYSQVLERYTGNIHRLNTSAPLLETNFVAFSRNPIAKTKIPREKHWSWNQSNAKVTVSLDGGDGFVTFKKISPRKRYSNLDAPKFKIWLFHVLTSTFEGHFLWCEQGVMPERKGVETETGTIILEEVTINSLSFLVPFVDAKTAWELG